MIIETDSNINYHSNEHDVCLWVCGMQNADVLSSPFVCHPSAVCLSFTPSGMFALDGVYKEMRSRRCNLGETNIHDQ